MTWSGYRGVLIDVNRNGEAAATVRVAGELDLLSAQAACDTIAQLCCAATRITLDLSRVTFCDLTGVRFLFDARRQAAASGAELVVCHPSRSVRRVLALSGALPALRPGGTGSEAPPAWPASGTVAICQRALGQALRVSGTDMANVQLAEPGSRALRLVAACGFPRRFLDFFETVHDEESACGAALAGAEPVWVPDVARSPIFAGTPSLDVMLQAGSKAVASVPVTAPGGSVIAMISVHHRQPTDWTSRHKQRLRALAAATGERLAGRGAASC